MTRSAELYACLYAKEFPAQSLLRLRPELHSKPCVVIEGDPPSQYVCSLNTKARLAGLARGMTRVEVDTFSEPIVLARSVQASSANKAAKKAVAKKLAKKVPAKKAMKKTAIKTIKKSGRLWR
jgi:protein ImuB